MNMRFGVQRFVASVCIAAVLFSSVPLPVAAENNGIASLVGSSGPVLGAVASCGINIGLYYLQRALETTVGDAEITPFPVVDPGGNYVQSGGTAASQASYFNEICLKPIEHAAGQVILKNITEQTVAWINHGFSGGGPLFVTDTASFLKSIRDQEVGGFVASLSDPTKFPFGKLVAQGLINDLKGYFEQNAEYSLDRVVAQGYPGHNGADFQADFAIGGWPAFISMQSPNNNPYGFQLEAQNTLAQRIGGTYYPQSQDARDQIQRGMGFLDLRKCVAPSDYSDAVYQQAQKTYRDVASDKKSTDEQKKHAADALDQFSCKQWQTQTPGSVIVNQLNTTLGSPLRQLEFGQDLSTDLTAIFDALLNQVMQKGLASLESSSSGNYSNNSNYASNIIITTDSGDGSSSGINENDQWFNQYPHFDVLKDLPTVIAREQDYETTLQSEVTTGNKVVSAIYELDYCIPGPNPTWELTSTQNMLTLISSIPNGGSQEHGAFLHDKLDIDTFLTGGGTGPGDRIATNTQVSDIIRSIFSQYKEAVKKVYNPSTLPSEAGPAAQEYKKLPQYQADISKNQDSAASTAGFIKQVQSVLARVNALPATTSPDYDATLSDIKASFTRIAPYLHTDFDVTTEKANLDTLSNTYDFLAKPKTGLIDECIADTNSSSISYAGGPLQRLPYPSSLTRNTHGFTLSTTFLPSYTYGTYDGSAHGNYDGDAQIQEYLAGTPVAGGWLDTTTPSTASGKDEIHISDLLVLTSAKGLAKFEKAIGIY